jgi:MarR-like DNA-binding transcriptional regulator SgrR of sgrS sRNA
VLLALSAIAPGTARGEGRALYGGTLEGALPSAAGAVDPLSPAPGDRELVSLIYDTPFRLDASGRPHPHLALSLEGPSLPPSATELASGARVRMRIRSDVRFHDGTPLGASDVAASITRALGTPAGFMLAPIRAARAIGSDVVELELSRAAPDLPLLLASRAASVLPAGRPRAGLPIGSGPFAVAAVEDGRVRLVANPAHFAGRPYLDTLTLVAFASRTEEAQRYQLGALRVARHLSNGQARATREGSASIEGSLVLTGFLALGGDLPKAMVAPLGSALAMGLDRERLRRQVEGHSERLESDATAPVDVARARALIGESRPSATLIYDRSDFDERAIADRLLVELGQLGVDVTIEPVESAQFWRRIESGQYGFALGVSAPPVGEAPLGPLALLALVDAPLAKSLLQRTPAASVVVDLRAARVIPLYRCAPRAHFAKEVRGLVMGGSGAIDWADLWLAP